MDLDWQELTNLTRGEPIQVERVRVVRTGIALEGNFTLPPLAKLTEEEQTFVIGFMRSHGSIKEMEKLFGISYPTVKNRLNRIAEKLEFVQTNPLPSRQDILSRIETGELSVENALEALKNV